MGTKVIQHGELFQGLVPPIQLAVTLIDILVCLFSVNALVVKRVGFHKDMRRLVLDNSIARLIHILVSDAAVLVLDFVIPFGTIRKDGATYWNHAIFIYDSLFRSNEERGSEAIDAVQVAAVRHTIVVTVWNTDVIHLAFTLPPTVFNHNRRPIY